LKPIALNAFDTFGFNAAAPDIIILRFPPAYITALKNFCSGFSTVEKIELLPFHKLGEYKWKELGIPYTLGDVLPPSNEKMEVLNKILNS
jgi:pyruvate-formate lyase-activating enzyme